MAEACLYVVATPIGNLGDISFRAVEVLKTVGVIAAEDTRHSARLLQHYQIKTPLISLHEHNEEQRANELVVRVHAGESIALISDAGTPLISDPGFRVVSLLREAGVRVVPVPGACAAVAALSVSGLPTDRFVFEGFLPAKSVARASRLEALQAESRTMIFYESVHRIQACLKALCEVFGPERQAVLARELTKQFETIFSGSLDEVQAFVASDDNQRKGEFVVLVSGVTIKKEIECSPEIEKLLRLLLAELPLKTAVAIAREHTGIARKLLYDKALELKAS